MKLKVINCSWNPQKGAYDAVPDPEAVEINEPDIDKALKTARRKLKARGYPILNLNVTTEGTLLAYMCVKPPPKPTIEGARWKGRLAAGGRDR